jgi:glycerol-3-phosphate cytidylyltransferase
MNQTRIVYTGGTFDLFHAGHVALLRACRRLAGDHGVVIIGLNSDEFVQRYKGRPPVVPYSDRLAVLEACRYVDRVTWNYGEENSRPVIEEVRATIIAVGVDWAVRDYYGQMQLTQAWLDDRGIQLVYVPHVPGLSTTRLKELIREQR